MELDMLPDDVCAVLAATAMAALLCLSALAVVPALRRTREQCSAVLYLVGEKCSAYLYEHNAPKCCKAAVQFALEQLFPYAEPVLVNLCDTCNEHLDYCICTPCDCPTCSGYRPE